MQFEIKKVFAKLKSHLNLDKDWELAEAMGVSVSTFGSWKSRNAIDFIFLFNFCEENNISLDWLLEIKTQNAISEPKTQYETDNIPKIDNLEARIKIIEEFIKNQIKE